MGIGLTFISSFSKRRNLTLNLTIRRTWAKIEEKTATTASITHVATYDDDDNMCIMQLSFIEVICKHPNKLKNFHIFGAQFSHLNSTHHIAGILLHYHSYILQCHSKISTSSKNCIHGYPLIIYIRIS